MVFGAAERISTLSNAILGFAFCGSAAAMTQASGKHNANIPRMPFFADARENIELLIASYYTLS